MPIAASSSNVESMHWLRMPVSGSAGNEYLEFTGIAIIDGIKGKGPNWERGTAQINAKYPRLGIDDDHAVLLANWTVDAHLASISNQQVATDTGWAVDRFSLVTEPNPNPGSTGTLSLRGGNLSVLLNVAARDIDAYILRISYRVSMVGRVIRAPFILG